MILMVTRPGEGLLPGREGCLGWTAAWEGGLPGREGCLGWHISRYHQVAWPHLLSTKTVARLSASLPLDGVPVFLLVLQAGFENVWL